MSRHVQLTTICNMLLIASCHHLNLECAWSAMGVATLKRKNSYLWVWCEVPGPYPVPAQLDHLDVLHASDQVVVAVRHQAARLPRPSGGRRGATDHRLASVEGLLCFVLEMPRVDMVKRPYWGLIVPNPFNPC